MICSQHWVNWGIFSHVQNGNVMPVSQGCDENSMGKVYKYIQKIYNTQHSKKSTWGEDASGWKKAWWWGKVGLFGARHSVEQKWALRGRELCWQRTDVQKLRVQRHPGARQRRSDLVIDSGLIFYVSYKVELTLGMHYMSINKPVFKGGTSSTLPKSSSCYYFSW